MNLNVILLCCIFFVLNVPLFAQTLQCGTNFSSSDLKWLRNVQQNPQSYPIIKRNVQRYVPIKAHVVGDDGGEGYYSLEYLFQAVCQLNKDYASMHMHFYLWGDIHYIDNSDFYEHDSYSSALMFAQNNVDQILNIYFVNDPNGACGYYSPYWDAIAIKKSCQLTGDHTITHEVGHYFSMPHTFYGWENSITPPLNQQEKVNGSNCQTAADGFCDTPPDYLSYIWGFNNCNSPTLTDPNGIDFQVDGSNFMSYATDACQSKFSNEQENAILGNLLYQRSYLVNNYSVPSDTVEPSLVNPVMPADGETGVPYNWVGFKWDPVPGATSYHLMVTELPTFANSNIDIITTNNYYIAELDEDETYRWKVKALVEGNTCADYHCQVFDCPEFTVGGYSNLQESKNYQPNIAYDQERKHIYWSNILSKFGPWSLSIYDLYGRVLYTIPIYEESGWYTLDINFKGIAFMRINSAEYTSAKSILF